jgi:hypothetical protein
MRINTFQQHKLIQGLPSAFTAQIRSIYEQDSTAVICGSLAMYLHGALDRLPNDVDVITAAPGVYESLMLNEAAPVTKEALDRVKSDVDVAVKKSKDYYTYMEQVRYLLSVESKQNLPDDIYAEVFTLWKDGRGTKDEPDAAYKKVDEFFSFYGNYTQYTRVSLFESTTDVPFDTIFVEGINVRLEKLEVIKKYKEGYGRRKDVSDLYEAERSAGDLKKIAASAEDITHLAKAFSLSLKGEIGAAKLKKAADLNKDEKSENICHSNDFCDANECMAAAFKAALDIDFEKEYDGFPGAGMTGADTAEKTLIEIWNKAWAEAKKNEFYLHKTSK